MKGKRTYMVIAVALLYVAGAKMGYWPLDGSLLAALGLLVTGFLRHAVGREKSPKSKGQSTKSEEKGWTRAPMRDRLPLPAILAALLALTGCARFHSTQENPDGTKTQVTITTVFDAHNEVAKLRTTQTDKTQGISLGSVNENSSGTNVVELLRVLGGILATLPK